MARAVYQHELNDPDFSWLLSRFQESHPEYAFVDSVTLPAVFIQGSPGLHDIQADSSFDQGAAAAKIAPENDPLVFGKTPPK